MAASRGTGGSWPPAARTAASVGIILYLAAVIVAPLAGPPPASALAAAMLQPLRPLVGGLYLGHGYRFFAPNPGPGHSIRWIVTMPDGSTRSGTIPDAKTDRPRLLYHRRFMVSEKIAALVPAGDAPAEIRDRARRDWQPLALGVARNLLRVHGGSAVALELVEHYLPTPEEILSGSTGSDAVTPLGSYGPAAERRP